MRLASIVCLCALAAVLDGCGPVKSLYPLVTAAGAEPVADLEGGWRDGDGEAVAVTRAGNDYTILGAEADSTERVEVRFVRLAGTLFADMSQPGSGGDVAVHYLARVRAGADTVAFELLDETWVREHRGPWWHRVRTAAPEGDFVLTEPTAGLQRYVRTHARAAGAFSEVMVLVRPR